MNLPDVWTEPEFPRMTPYTFNPKIGRKLVGRYYLDMGQGLLACLNEINDKEIAPFEE
jgi:hypothetical protein